MAFSVASSYTSITWCSDYHSCVPHHKYLFSSTILSVQFAPVLQQKHIRFWWGIVNRSTSRKFFRSQNIVIIVFNSIVAIVVTFAIAIIIRCIGENHIRRNHLNLWVNIRSISIHGNAHVRGCFLFIFDIISVDYSSNTTLLILLFQTSIAPHFWPRFFSDQNGS